MSADIIVVFALGPNIGRRARLTVWPTNTPGIVQDGDLLTTRLFDEAITKARDVAFRLLGNPPLQCGFRWAIRKFPHDNVPVENPDGDSLYGAFSLTFLQLLAKAASRGQMVAACSHTLALLPAVRGAALSKVAVTAGPCSHTTNFRAVDGIPEKLRCLASLDSTTLTTCLVAREQLIPDNVFNIATEEQILRRVPITRVQDAIDAFGRLFEEQSRRALRRLV